MYQVVRQLLPALGRTGGVPRPGPGPGRGENRSSSLRPHPDGGQRHGQRDRHRHAESKPARAPIRPWSTWACRPVSPCRAKTWTPWSPNIKDVPKITPAPTIQRYELTGRQILVYIQPERRQAAATSATACAPASRSQCAGPASSAYDYYNPSVSGEAQPVVITVK